MKKAPRLKHAVTHQQARSMNAAVRVEVLRGKMIIMAIIADPDNADQVNGNCKVAWCPGISHDEQKSILTQLIVELCGELHA